MSPYTTEMEALLDARVAISNLSDSREKTIILDKLEEAYLYLKELEQAGSKE